jgi:hypothetical protein
MLRTLRIVALLMLGPSALPSSATAQLEQVTVTVNGLWNQGLQTHHIDLYLAPTLSACGTYSPVPTPDCRITFIDGFGGPPELVAQVIEFGINNSCAGSSPFAAHAVGNRVDIIGPVGFDIGISGSEFDACGGLRVRECTVNNVSDQHPCNQTSPHSGGFQLIGSGGGPISTVPALPSVDLAVLVVLALALGVAATRRMPLR